MTENFSNFADTKLAAAITSTSATSILVNSTTNFPAPNFRIWIDEEVMLVTAVSGTNWTVTRGYEESTAAVHSISAAVIHGPTAGMMAQFAGQVQSIFGRTGIVTAESSDYSAFYDTLGAAAAAQSAAESYASNANNISSGTINGARLPFPSASIPGAIYSNNGAVHNFVTGIYTDGTLILGRPAQADITGLTSADSPAFQGLSVINLNAGGIVKTTASNGTLLIATAGTDYQIPITLTTTGSSGAATFSGGTLNIPQYGGGAVSSVFGRTGSVVASSSDYSSYYDALGAASTAQSNAETYASNASNLSSGTVTSARISGSYTGITGVGTIAAGVWQGTAIAASYIVTGTSGAAIPLLNGANTWSSAQTFSAAPLFSTMTAGSALVAGASGVLSQDAAYYFYDLTNHRLCVGANTPISWGEGTTHYGTLSVTGSLAAASSAGEHFFQNSMVYGGDVNGVNVMSIQHTQSNGCSAIRFLDNNYSLTNNTEQGAVGYANGTWNQAISAYYGAVYLATSNLFGTAPYNPTTAVPLVLGQYASLPNQGVGFYNQVLIDTSGNFNIQGGPNTAVVNLLYVPQSGKCTVGPVSSSSTNLLNVVDPQTIATTGYQAKGYTYGGIRYTRVNVGASWLGVVVKSSVTSGMVTTDQALFSIGVNLTGSAGDISTSTIAAYHGVGAFTIPLNSVSARFNQIAQNNLLTISTNFVSGTTQDSSTNASWQLQMGNGLTGGGVDYFNIQRMAAAGSSFTSLLALTNAGALTVPSSITASAGGINCGTVGTAQQFLVSMTTSPFTFRELALGDKIGMMTNIVGATGNPYNNAIPSWIISQGYGGGATSGNYIGDRWQIMRSAAGNTYINAVELFGVSSTGALGIAGKIATYNGVTTAGIGAPIICAYARVSAVTAAQASLTSYSVPAADSSFRVSANINVTAAATASFTATVTYTDETNTSRTETLNFTTTAGVISNGAIIATGAYSGVPVHIRCKASTTITIATTGTFTSVTYNAEGCIQQVA